jgi:hypothetical protein
MLDFSDHPYHYFPPHYSPVMAWLLRRINYRWHLPRSQRIASVQVSLSDATQAALVDGSSVMLLPNHSTHSDAAILLETSRQLGIVPQIMAAYDVFLRSRIDGLVMRLLGTFSVDREGSDSRAMKQAAATLQEGKFALTIFPEGNVYLTSDVVTPFHEGAAFLALREVKDWPPGRQLLAIPISIKATFCEDVREALLNRLQTLARHVDCKLDEGLTPVQMIHRVGLAGLQRNLRHRGIELDHGQDVAAALQPAADAVLRQVERKAGISSDKPMDLIERVRAVRRRIHEVRIDPQRAADHAAAATWADEAMLAFRIASYSGSYVASNPTVDRIGETIEKLCEDGYSRYMPPIGRRAVYVHLGDPLDVRGYWQPGVKLREAARRMTDDAEAAVQRGIDRINAGNRHPGGQRWG